MASHSSNNSRSRAIRNAFSSIRKTVSNIITFPYRRLTRRRILVHPTESSPKNKTSKVKSKKHQPNYSPPSTYTLLPKEEVDVEDIKLENLGSCKTRKTNKKRSSCNK